jgi:hypothetical protein
VNAHSGELAWKSRPPGNGFTILVDGHLVIMTKRGSLHVAKASSEGYIEIANLPLFDKLLWSPPSFANGKFYVRNSFDEIACVGVVNRSLAAVEKSPLPPSMFFPNSEFGKFVKQVESASEKRALIDQFINSQKQFPVIEGDSLVHIIYRGEARDVALREDMFEYGDEILMHRLSGTDFFMPLSNSRRTLFCRTNSSRIWINELLTPAILIKMLPRCRWVKLLKSTCCAARARNTFLNRLPTTEVG